MFSSGVNFGLGLTASITHGLTFITCLSRLCDRLWLLHLCNFHFISLQCSRSFHSKPITMDVSPPSTGCRPKTHTFRSLHAPLIRAISPPARLVDCIVRIASAKFVWKREFGTENLRCTKLRVITKELALCIRNAF